MLGRKSMVSLTVLQTIKPDLSISSVYTCKQRHLLFHLHQCRNYQFTFQESFILGYINNSQTSAYSTLTVNIMRFWFQIVYFLFLTLHNFLHFCHLRFFLHNIECGDKMCDKAKMPSYNNNIQIRDRKEQTRKLER